MIELDGWKFEAPRKITDADGCYFYHTMDVPSSSGMKTHVGAWDLRGRYDDYLSNLNVHGKSVLDVGTATGWISFEVERRGAKEVVGLDMAGDVEPDLVPYTFLNRSTLDSSDRGAKVHEDEGDGRKGYWYCHTGYGSKVKLVLGDAYKIGSHVRGADIVILGQILVHQRDPLKVLHECAKVADKTIVIVEGSFESDQSLMRFGGLNNNYYSWFHLSTELYTQYLRILGFEVASINRNALPL